MSFTVWASQYEFLSVNFSVWISHFSLSRCSASFHLRCGFCFKLPKQVCKETNFLTNFCWRQIANDCYIRRFNLMRLDDSIWCYSMLQFDVVIRRCNSTLLFPDSRPLFSLSVYLCFRLPARCSRWPFAILNERNPYKNACRTHLPWLCNWMRIFLVVKSLNAERIPELDPLRSIVKPSMAKH